jgi:cell division transport system permease protein
MFITLKRIIRSGLKTFLRNGLLSASSVVVMTITMVTILAVFFSTVLIKASVVQIENKVDVNIYFKPDAAIGQVLEFKKIIEELPGVDLEKTNFISREDVFNNFKAKHKENEVILEGLDIVDDNPLGAVMNIKAKKINSYSEIADFIESSDIQKKYSNIINNLNYNENKKAIEKLNVLIEYAYKIGGIVSLILVIISIIVTFNTMRLTIYTFKEEISIMRLVGASKFFARGPFVVEGILYGIISAIFSLFIVWMAVYYLSPSLNKVFILNLNQFLSAHILEISGSLLLGGIILGFISTYLSVSKYLKV